MATVGIFTRKDAQKIKQGGGGKSLKPTPKTLEKLECTACKYEDYIEVEEELTCDNPEYMIVATKPRGKNAYFNTQDDRLFSSDIINNAIITGVCKCYIKNEELDDDVKYTCKKKTLALIEKYKPKVIFAMGLLAIRSLVSNKGTQGDWVGRICTANFNGHSCFVVPLFDVDLIHKFKQDPYKKFDDVPHDCWVDAQARAIIKAKELLNEVPRPVDTNTLYENTTVISETYSQDLENVLRILNSIEKDELPIGVDIETTGLSPFKNYKRGHKNRILSLAIGNKKQTVTFLLEHPNKPWSEISLMKLKLYLHRFFTKKNRRFIAHNAKFEMLWLADYFKDRAVLFEPDWHCTQAQAFIIDERVSLQSLEELTIMNFGFNLKAVSNLDRSKLVYVPIEKMLKYNALDTKFTTALFYRHNTRLKKDKLVKAYIEFVSALPALADAELSGVIINQEKVKQFYDETAEKHNEAVNTLFERKEIQDFIKTEGEFNPESPKQVLKLLTQYYGLDVPNTDKKILKEHNFLDLIAVKELEKFRGTYIKPLMPKSEKTVLCADNRVHCHYNPYKTVTTRLSSSEPNLQNIPVRTASWLREMFLPDEGELLVGIDWGQIEVRILGACTQDPVLLDALWDDVDIHLEWTEKLLKACPEKLEQYKDVDDYRKVVKNLFTFPLFYGSRDSSVARTLDIRPDKLYPIINSLWQKYSTIKAWQDELLATFKRYGYIENLVGTRRRSPATSNMIINYPMQSLSAYLMKDCWLKLAKKAYYEDKPYLAPRLSVHDELIFSVKEQNKDELIEVATDTMLYPSYDWLNVPLTCDVEVGTDWGNLEKYKTCKSNLSRDYFNRSKK